MPPGVAESSVLDQLLSELQQRGVGGTKATSMPPVGPYMHGPNGLWSYPGLERPVISTRVRPRGLAGTIPSRSNNSMNPLYPYLTGFVEGTGSQPNATCDDCPTPGPLKNCFQTAIFGRYCYQTRTLDITRMGQIINRGEFTDLMIWNDPIGGPANSPGAAGIVWPDSTPGNVNLNNEASIRFAEVGVAFQSKLMKQIYEGNPTNNTAGGGYREFVGLDILVGTGKRDAVTGTVCPSLDSTIVNAAGQDVGQLIDTLTYTMRYLKSLASSTGLDPTTWVLTMREELFFELTAEWPCNYLTYRCVFNNDNVQGAFDMGDAIAMRDAMRAGQYLVVDGTRWNVVVDDALPMSGSGGNFTSDIYILPLTVQGNKSVLFWEYFDWQGPNAALNAATIAAAPMMSNYYWTDGGQYIWHLKPPVNWCVQWIGLIEPRLILLTPHLAARIENVSYTAPMVPRQPFPNDPYYVNGGVTGRTTAPSWYGPGGQPIPQPASEYFVTP
jgi:hypothetical protein